MQTIRHAIVGCGVIGPYHARSLATLPGSRLTVACDLVRERAEQLAAGHDGCAVETNLEATLARDDVDLVHLCTPSGLHADHAVAAISAGKHVIVEKPMDITLPACDRLIAAAEASDRKVTCIFQSRFMHGPRAVKQAVDQGLLGRLVMGDAYVKWYRTQAYYDSGDWRATWELDGGGCLMNQSVHYIDLLQWFMGEVATVDAICDTLAHDIAVEDVAAAVLRYRSGAIGVIEGTTAATPGLSWRIELHGDAGSIVLRDGRIDEWRFLDPVLDQNPPEDPRAGELRAAGADPSSLPDTSHADQIAAMCEAIRRDGPVPVPVREARRAVEIINAIYRSSHTGSRVALPLEG